MMDKQDAWLVVCLLVVALSLCVLGALYGNFFLIGVGVSVIGLATSKFEPKHE